MCKKCKRTLEEPQALGAFHVSGAFDALAAARTSRDGAIHNHDSGDKACPALGYHPLPYPALAQTCTVPPTCKSLGFDKTAEDFADLVPK